MENGGANKGTKLLELYLKPQEDQVRYARLAARTALGPDHPARERVENVVSELTTNAVRYSEPGPIGDLILVVVKQVRDFVHVEVTDPGSTTHTPHIPEHPPEELSEGGYGLLLVQTIAPVWGVRDFAACGRTVWAAVPLQETEEPKDFQTLITPVPSPRLPAPDSGQPPGSE